jgi:hypothetical protein
VSRTFGRRIVSQYGGTKCGLLHLSGNYRLLEDIYMARKNLARRTKRTIIGEAKSKAIRAQRIAVKAATAAATAAAEAAVAAVMRSMGSRSNGRSRKAAAKDVPVAGGLKCAGPGKGRDVRV